MHKLVPGATALALAAGLAVTVASGAQGQGQGGPPAQERTIVLYEQDKGSTFRFVDAKPFTRSTKEGPKRISAGDGLVIGSPLTTDMAHTQPAGRLRVHCVAMNRSRRFDRVTFLCDGAYKLQDGTIAISGLFKPTQGPQLIKVAVVGGTDAYEGARGSVTIDDSNPEQSKDIIHLLGD